MMATQKKEAKTVVWWDINGCPLPDEVDPLRVRGCIESALKKSGYSIPVTITAIGNLRLTLRNRPGVLEAISSTGIFLKHILRGFETEGLYTILEDILAWRLDNPPPANIMLISGGLQDLKLPLDNLQDPRPGYTILRANPQTASSLATSKIWVWESLLKEPQVALESCSEMPESRWVCTICQPYYKDEYFGGQNFETLAMHLRSAEHKRTELDYPDPEKMQKNNSYDSHLDVDDTTGEKSIEEEEIEEKEEDHSGVTTDGMPMVVDTKTVVWWDINSCPVLDDWNPLLIRPSIESKLKNLGFSGPVTITAIGKLNHLANQRPDVLRGIYSTGIHLKHVLSDFKYIWSDLLMWTMANPPPANILLISSGGVEDMGLLGKGYISLWACPNNSSDVAKADWVWESLLEDWESQVGQENHNERSASRWDCNICHTHGVQSVEEFTMHLKDRDRHAPRELDTVVRPMRSRMVKFLESTLLMDNKSRKRRAEERVKSIKWEQRSSLDSMLSMQKVEDEDNDWDEIRTII